MSATILHDLEQRLGDDDFEVLAEIATTDGDIYTLYRDNFGQWLHHETDDGSDGPGFTVSVPPGLLRALANASEQGPRVTVDYCGRA
jgi:hypothetical protein